MLSLQVLNEEELAQKLEATKLYVPGRVLWMTYEEEPLLRRLLVRAHAHAHTRTHTYTHTCTHTHMHKHAHTQTRALAHAHTCTHMHTHTDLPGVGRHRKGSKVDVCVCHTEEKNHISAANSN
jgi:ABC-type nickel/cobalt efflux system permease component RcnA